MSARIGIIAALPGELRPLVKGWERLQVGRHHYRTERHGAEYIAVACGAGAQRATLAVEAAAADGPLTALLSIGWAGGLSCGVQPGVAYVVTEIIDPRTGERYATGTVTTAPMRLVTADHVAGGAEKRRLAESYSASLVDMEAATVARMAQIRGIAFGCVKVISDRATDEMPDFNRLLGRDGQLSLLRLVPHLLVRPRYWPTMVRLGRNTALGSRVLAHAVSEMMEQGVHGNSNL
jgi:adenosylhomocysteine nucleosidase